MKQIITLVALLAITGVYGQLDRSVRPNPAQAPTININDSEVFKTSNGITVVLSENHKLPRVSFDLVMGASPVAEGPKSGVNSIMGQLILSGTSNRTKDVLDAEVDYMGATLNADGNSLYLSCLSKHLDKALGIMQDVVLNTTFPESEFDRIKKQAESGLLSAKASPDEMANNAEKRANFAGHPYGDVMNEASLAAITRADVLANFNQIFTPQGAYLVIVGDITKDQAKALAEKYFGTWKGQSLYKVDLGGGKSTKGNRVIFVNKPGAVQSVISISLPVDVKSGDKNQLPLTVLSEILGGGSFGSSLMQNLREDKAYTYGCRSDLQITRDGSWMSASGSFRNEVTDSAITQILYEFARIQEGYVTDQELALTKASMAGGFARSLESPQTIARFALNIIRNNLSADYYKNYLKRLDAIDKETVLLMAQQYLASGYNIVVVGNESVLDKIKQFDADGVIEKMDAFGNPVVEMKAANITADQLLEKYILAVTQTTSMKAATKKMKKIKSVTKEMELSAQQLPGKLKMSDAFQAPNSDASQLEMQGMVLQRQYFNGTTGGSTNMQEGKKPLSPEALAAKKKSVGLFPEMNYKTSGMTYELKGIENQNGTDFYVLFTTDGDKQQFDYFDIKTFLKSKSVIIQTQEGETSEQAISFSDYKDVNGLLFPHAMNLMMGEMGLTGKIVKIEVNGKVDPKLFVE
ncbi:MAG: insulinase family protein [Flavobacteriia bacterium]|nr:insulinase family protein [Flavobacteriia bacterium]